jgi:protein-disulfide isomerase
MPRSPRSAAAALAAAALLLGPTPARSQTAAPSATQAAANDLLDQRTKGSATAPVRVIEMSDFQCPWCRKFTVETAGILDREYVATGKVRWIFINLPIVQLHPNAGAAAELAMCAAAQGKFWPMHDLLYQHQDTWAPLNAPEQYLLTLVDSLRIPRDSVLPCLRTAKMRDLVQRDLNTAQRIGARSTPSFLIEGVLLAGAQPVELFRHILDSIYTARTATR